MYSDVRRNGKYITRLSEFIRREYQIVPVAITPANRGFFGETWRLEAAAKNYFIKIAHYTRPRRPRMYTNAGKILVPSAD